ncbi:MAG: leucine-rich repeat protein [Lachnospiraceae bacterium]|nr:leucine-rich repeat protein [Lachnospiraceae bacterium]
MKMRKRFLVFILLFLVGFLSGERVYAASDTVIGEAAVKTESMTGEEEAAEADGGETRSVYEVVETANSDDVPAGTGAAQTWPGGVATATLEDGVLTVSGSGAMTDYTSSTYSSVPWYSYGEEITSIVIESGITHIGDFAFMGTCAESVSLPGTLKTIGEAAFYQCYDLTSVTIPDSVQSIGTAAFADCTSLKSIILGSSVQTIGSYAFQGTAIIGVTIPSSVTTLGSWVFTECTSLTSLTIPDSVTTIGYGLANNCTALKTVKIGKGIETLEYGSFYNCTALASVTLGSGLKTIDSLAFYNCTALKSLTIPDSVTYVDAYAFYNCTNLTVTYPSTLIEMEDGSYQAFDTVTLTGTYCYSEAYEVLELVNKERAAEGLSALTMDKDLLAAAMKRAAEINIYFSHTRPSNIDCFTISTKASGENIAAGQTSASSVMTSWMNSSGHKANILGSSYQSIGIGCFMQGDVIYWVQVFGTGTATKVSQPSDVKKTVTVALESELFTDCLYLSTVSSVKVAVGSDMTFQAYMTNPEWTYCSAKLNNSSLTWSSNAKASVSSKGVMTAKKTGTAKVTASTSSGDLKASATATVAKVAKDAQYNVGNYCYKVTSSASGSTAGQVTLVSVVNKTAAVKIPATVELGGKTYRVTAVGSSAFKKNTKMTSLSVGKYVKKIGSNAFYGCTSLKKVTGCANLTSVGSGAFSGCTKLATVSGCTKVTTIGKKAFYNCKKLTQIGSKTSVITLAKVKTIGASAFYACKSVKKVNLTSTALTSIGESAFQSCTKLTSFSSSSKKLNSIGKKAFYKDAKLATITLKTSKLTKSNVKSNAFKGIKSTCTFKVPSAKVSSYKAIFKARGAGSKIKVKAG